MNYILVSLNNIPEYIKYTINSILSVDSDAKVYLFTDKKIEKLNNVEIVDINEVISNQTKGIKDKDLFAGTIFDKNPLWETSLLRVFYLEDIQKSLNLKQFIHFDNDVIVYKPFEKIKDSFKGNKLNITKPSNARIIFGYSFIDSFEALEYVNKSIIKLMDFGVSTNWEFNYKVPYNEMDYLGKAFNEDSKFFHTLPILPFENKEQKLIFDPSSYGQYFDGTHTSPKKLLYGRYINLDHYIGREIKVKRIKVRFKNSEPIVFWKKEKFELINLHVHSKRLYKFLPKDYKEIV